MHSETSQTSKMEHFANIVDFSQLLTIFAKHSITGVLQDKCDSDKTKQKLDAVSFFEYFFMNVKKSKVNYTALFQYYCNVFKHCQ